MNQTILKKLFAAGMAVIISVVLIVTVTYAWTTLSTAPIAEGIQITIGGGNTILIAPNMEQTIGEKTYGIPGAFNETLVFSKQKEYDYLKNIDSLSPVSTADGINFFIPTYYDITDEEVKNGQAAVGELKPFSEFKNDNELLNANLEKGEAKNGHYVYLDFWVVSPGTDYTLRVARGDENGGSYLIELPKAYKTETGYALEETNNAFSSSARIGFLANTNYVDEVNYNCYRNSRFYNSNYKKLMGTYSEKGEYSYQAGNRFTIYEPNGDYTLGNDTRHYVETKPLGINGSEISPVSIFDRLTVQLKNSWTSKSQDNITLNELLSVSLSGKKVKNEKQAETILYDEYLQGQFAPYVSRGDFITSTSLLSDKCSEDGVANELELASLATSGATEDVFIVKLEKNVPQRIRMFVWLEGQDVDCSDDAEVGRFALSLELAASNQE